jgi:hypothetical protein
MSWDRGKALPPCLTRTSGQSFLPFLKILNIIKRFNTPSKAMVLKPCFIVVSQRLLLYALFHP